jgi:hypothetical protein
MLICKVNDLEGPRDNHIICAEQSNYDLTPWIPRRWFRDLLLLLG